MAMTKYKIGDKLYSVELDEFGYSSNPTPYIRVFVIKRLIIDNDGVKYELSKTGAMTSEELECYFLSSKDEAWKKFDKLMRKYVKVHKAKMKERLLEDKE
jgi:hypothetical protein